MPSDTSTYIRDNWERSFSADADGSGFKGDDLPFPYTSPCIRGEGKFSFFFYWDTYFTNLGLLRHGHREMARNNIRNMLWLIDRQGFVPNHTALFNRSQSPYLCRMVEDYFAMTGGPDAEPDFFRACCEGLRREHHFWMLARLHGTGLNQYGHSGTWEDQERQADRPRVKRIRSTEGASRAEKRRIGAHFLAAAEATCDYSPRFENRTLDFLQPDLNGLLYEYEVFFARHADRLGWKEFRPWAERAEERKERIQRHLWSEERGLYLDWDHVHERHSEVAALTGVQLLAHGIPTQAQARRIRDQLPLFEREHGIAYAEPSPDDAKYQWAFPNVWPPMVFMTVEGLIRYGFHEDARRIAEKYVRTTDRLFARTGRLWEKTDARTGATADEEYDAAAMMGWTAGVYVACSAYLDGEPVVFSRD